MIEPSEDESERLAELRRFDFLYETKQEELKRICSIAKKLFDASVASVVMVDRDNIKLLSTDGSEVTTAPRNTALSTLTLDHGDYLEIEDISKDIDAEPRAGDTGTTPACRWPRHPG